MFHIILYFLFYFDSKKVMLLPQECYNDHSMMIFLSFKAQIWGFSVTQLNENDSHLAAYYVMDYLASIHILSMILDSDPTPSNVIFRLIMRLFFCNREQSGEDDKHVNLFMLIISRVFCTHCHRHNTRSSG